MYLDLPYTRPTAPLGPLTPVSHVEFKKWSCRMSLNYLFKSHVASKMLSCRMSNLICRVTIPLAVSIGLMSHVDLKKWPCRRVKFRGQGPYLYIR